MSSVKIEKVLYKNILRVLFVLFLPILICIFLFGNNMDYNDVCKLVTLCPNYLLVGMAFVLFVLYGLFYETFRKIRYTPLTSQMLNIVLIICYVLVFFLNYEIAKCIYLEQGWDVSCVRYKAIELSEGMIIGKDDPYFSIYSNNVPITYVLYKLYDYAKEMKDFPYTYDFIWVIINCIMISVAGYISCIIVKKLTKSIAPVVLTFFIYVFCVCVTPWKTAAYTDMYAIMFPVLCMALYVYYYFSFNNLIKHVLWFFMFLSGFIGSLIKPPVLIICIAIMITELIHGIMNIKMEWKSLLIKLALIGIVVLLYINAKEVIYEETGFIYNENAAVTYHHYLLMGSSENSTGSYDSDVLWFHGQYTTPEERIPAQWNKYREQLMKHGFPGYLEFLLKKMVMTFNDGTFGWGREGDYTYYSFPTFSFKEYAPFLRDVFWPNFKYSGRFNTFSQMIWMIIIFAIPGMCLGKKEDRVFPILALSLLGIMGYLMLFETRARYLICFLPLIIVMAVLGMQQYSVYINRILIRIKGLIKK